MRTADRIHEQFRVIWRNLPSFPSTFSACKCGRGAGRGGGPCIQCAEESLAILVGKEAAHDYVAAALEVRRIERLILEGIIL